MVVKAGEGKLDMEVLKTQDKLSDEDFQKIQEEVLAEEGGKPKEEVVEEPAKKEGEEETPEAKEAREKSEAEAATKEVEAIAAENKRILESKEEELTSEDKEKRSELIKAEGEAKSQKEAEDKKLKEQIDVEVKAYAAEHKISEDEARSDFDSREKILEKYKGDPKQLALANLHLQRLYTKTQENLKAAEEAKPSQSAKAASIEDYIKLIDDGQVLIKGKKITREDAISIYREQFPDVSENLDDDAVIKLVGKELKEGYTKKQESDVAALSAAAKEKRAEVLNALPEADKKLIPEIQPMLEKYPAAAIMSESFKIEDLVNWAKGKRYDQDLKEFGQKEYLRGLQQAKIIGQKGGPASGSQKQVAKGKVVNLTDAQKKEALSMYEGTTFTDDEKFANYAEVMAIDTKEKK